MVLLLYRKVLLVLNYKHMCGTFSEFLSNLEHYLGVFTLGLLDIPTRFLSKRTLVASFVRLYEATISKRRSARSNAVSGELTSPLASSPNDPIHSLAHTLKSYAVSRPPIVNPRQLFSSVRNCMGLRNTFHRIVQKYFWGQTFWRRLLKMRRQAFVLILFLGSSMLQFVAGEDGKLFNIIFTWKWF